MRFDWHLRRNHYVVHPVLAQRLDDLDNADRAVSAPKFAAAAAAAVTVTQLTSKNRDLVARICLKRLQRLNRLFRRQRSLALESADTSILLPVGSLYRVFYSFGRLFCNFIVITICWPCWELGDFIQDSDWVLTWVSVVRCLVWDPIRINMNGL